MAAVNRTMRGENRQLASVHGVPLGPIWFSQLPLKRPNHHKKALANCAPAQLLNSTPPHAKVAAMRNFSPILILSLAVAALACTAPAAPKPAAAAADIVPADVAPADLVPADVAPADTAPRGPPEPAWPVPDSVLRASTAARDLFAPLGISTGGYAQGSTKNAPKSPFATNFRATTQQLQPPRVQVIHLVQGSQRLVLVQTDTIGVLYSSFEYLVLRVQARTGVDIRGSLVLSANHTHAGPGHLFNALIAGTVTDSYDEQIFARLLETVADAVVAALQAEAVPVRVGHLLLQEPRLHGDRRCENPDHRNDTLAVLRLDRVAGGALAVVLNYAMHGTVLDFKHGALSGDAPRLVEDKVREALPAAPLVMFLQSWAGDMSPANVLSEFKASPVPPHAFEPLDRMEALGRVAAEVVVGAWQTMAWQDNPLLAVASVEAGIDRELIGYQPGQFEQPDGAVLCGAGEEACANDPPADMTACLPLPPGGAPRQVRLTAFRLGELVAVTLPGEPVTTLGEQLLAVVKQRTGAKTALLLGYAQDYLGYLLLPDDWQAGGYEPSMTYWGPRQGEYLAARAADLAEHLFAPAKPLAFATLPPRPYNAGPLKLYAPSPSLAVGTVDVDLPAQTTTGVAMAFGWTGGDPWLDAPEVTVERKTAQGFLALLLGGVALDARSYRTVLTMQPQPGWAEVPVVAGQAPTPRTFHWQVTLRLAVHVPGPEQVLQGELRVRVKGRALTAAGEQGYEVVSKAVNVGG